MTTKLKWGRRVAFLLATLFALQALWSPMPAVLFAALFFLAAWRIGRGSQWSAYGAALLLLAPLPGQMEVAQRSGNNELVLGFVIVVCIDALLAWVLYRAGTDLSGTPPREKFAWIALGSLTLGIGLFTQAFVLPTASMENTMFVGDQFLVQTRAYSAPQPGDIIVFRYPVDTNQLLTKRVVGIPGDRLKIVNKKLFRNGVALIEPYVTLKTDYIDSYRDNFPAEPNMRLLREDWDKYIRKIVPEGEITIPPGKLFVLGDNRDSSLDSRYFGFVSAKEVYGKPLFIYFSVERPDRLSPNAGLPLLFGGGNVRWNRIGTRL